jgi:hypothetical protein
MQIQRLLIAVIALGCAYPSLASATSPFAGKWKFNEAKSKLTGTTDSVASTGPNAWNFMEGNLSWTIKADGTDQAVPFGGTVALKVNSATNWTFTHKANGKLSSTETWVLAADGKSMTRTSTGKMGDGTPFNDVVTEKRTAGGKGMEGTWASSGIKATWTDLVIEDNGATGITVTELADSLKTPLTMDGKESPVTGPLVPPGSTTVTKANSPRSLAVTTKMNGKVLDTETWEISTDGKTLTCTETDPGEPQPTVIVYDKI